MMSSKQLFRKPNEHHNHPAVRRLVFALLGVAPLGFADAVYLTVEHYANRVPPCTILHGCEQVTTSAYSFFYGIPVALLGALYYLAIIVGVALYLDTKRELILKAPLTFVQRSFSPSVLCCGAFFSRLKISVRQGIPVTCERLSARRRAWL